MFKQELINLGYKIIKERDVLALEFESEVLNGFKLRGNTYIYDEDSKLGFRLAIGIGLYVQDEKFDDFEEYGPIYRKFTYSITEVLPSLESLIDNFKKYCGNSTKQAIEYNFEELMALDEKITGNTYKSIKI